MTATGVASPGAGRRPNPGQTRPRVYLSAGEPSGDEHLARVAVALARRGDAGERPQLQGMGGPHLAAAGVALHTNCESLTAMGLAEVVRTLPRHLAAWRAALRTLASGPPDVAILADYPAFHRWVGHRFVSSGVPVLQYIAPKRWAWGESRVRHLRTACTHLAAIFPFEPAFFHARGIPTTYVGHPVLDVEPPTRAQARSRLGIGADDTVVGMFPGSRRQETDRMSQPMERAWLALRKYHPGLRGVVAARSGTRPMPPAAGVQVVEGRAPLVMAAADVVVCASGTSTLLAARCGTPIVVVYRLHPLTFQVARRVVRTTWVSLPNILAGREVVPELLQGEMRVDRIVESVDRLLHDERARDGQREAFASIIDRLGPGGVAERVADLAVGLRGSG